MLILSPIETDLLLLSLAAGTIAVTITHSPITRPIRQRMIGWPLMLGELANCPYCMAHWIALGLALYAGGSFGTIFLNAVVITGGAAIFSGIMLKVLIFREAELEEMRRLLAEAGRKLRERG